MEETIWIVYFPPGEDLPVVVSRKLAMLFAGALPDGWQGVFRFQDEAERFAKGLAENQSEM